jgi:hypothetical protein
MRPAFRHHHFGVSLVRFRRDDDGEGLTKRFSARLLFIKSLLALVLLVPALSLIKKAAGICALRLAGFEN